MTQQTNMPDPPDQPPRIAALATVAIALMIGVAAWFWFGRAADVGLERLTRIDKVRTLCQGYYAQATSSMDSMRVDRLPLPDTIDPASKEAIDRCGDLRGPESDKAPPNPREMGEEIPRGLR